MVATTAPATLDGGVEAPPLLVVEHRADDVEPLGPVGPEELAPLGPVTPESLAQAIDLVVVEIQTPLQEPEATLRTPTTPSVSSMVHVCSPLSRYATRCCAT